MSINIPKKIHYCWFGGNELPMSAIKCIESWKKFLPDYEIIQWDESNYDINKCDYVRDAYKEKKWAHVSDYARMDILYHHGGLYFDTDVEVIKPFDDLLINGPFMGCESTFGRVAPGLGLATNKGNRIYKEILESYESSSFYKENGELDLYNTIVVRTTNVLKKYGYVDNGQKQIIEEIVIYPKEYFNPMVYETGEIKVSENTYSIHWYDGSWLPKSDKHIHKIEQKIKSKFKGDFGTVLSFVYRKGYRVLEKLRIIK